VPSTGQSTTSSTGPPPGSLEQIERVFGFTFSDAERRLLAIPDSLLGHLDGQRRYVLAMALQTCECPACGYLLCQRSAATGGFDLETSTPDDAYACPHCKAGLTWHLALIAGGQWFTVTR
jgi:hypothetical protein